jgi:hypothetical protein
MTAKRATRGATTCRAGRCQIECPPGGCGCIYVYETDSCNCECFGEERRGSTGVLGLGNKIDVSVSGLPLGQVAARFDRLLTRDVLVPSGRVKDRVRLRLTGVRVSAALGALGLATQKRTKPRSAKRRG